MTANLKRIERPCFWPAGRRAVRTTNQWRLAGCAALLLIVFSQASLAQDIRVYTRVLDESAAEHKSLGQAPILSFSLTLFHAGKVYDYVPTVGELVIVEPALEQFTIVNGSRMLAVHVRLDELNQLLDIARREMLREVERLADHADSASRQQVALLQAQLQPDFDEQFDEAALRLTMDSPLFRYDVTCNKPESSEVSDRYLRYADWAARINYVLHPHAFYPNVRLALNERLRSRGLFPTEVELRGRFDHPVHLRAVHKIHWSLDAKDRQDIHRWETLLQDEDLRLVTFHEYQHAMLVSQTREWKGSQRMKGDDE